MSQDETIPRLYETENIPLENKTIHQHYYLSWNAGFYWLIAELDPEQQLGFGYACLNDPPNAEWGYISIQELEDVGAALNEYWKPCRFKEALFKAKNYIGEDELL